MKKLTFIAILTLTTSFGFGQTQEGSSSTAERADDIIVNPNLVPLNLTNTPNYVDHASTLLMEAVPEEKTIAGELPKAYLKLHQLQEVSFENYTYYTTIPKELANILLTNYLG